VAAVAYPASRPQLIAATLLENVMRRPSSRNDYAAAAAAAHHCGRSPAV
jgi:hypothetical protein